MIKSKLHLLMAQKKIKSVNQLSKECDVSLPTLYRIQNETGDRIEYKTLDTLCRFFNCQVGDILYWEEGD